MAGVFKSETPEIKQHGRRVHRISGFKKTHHIDTARRVPCTKARRKNRFAINNLCDFYCYVPNVFVMIILPRTLLLPSLLLLPASLATWKFIFALQRGALTYRQSTSI